MGAIYQREMKAYFSSAIGFVFLAVFLFYSGYLFVNVNIAGATSSMSTYFSNMIFIYVLLIPILTMRLMSEDKKQKTDQILLTSPVSLFGIVLGKFFAALTLYGIGLSVSAVFGLILATFAKVEGAEIVGNLVAMVLLGAGLIAVGIFISSLTESQVIAGVASIFVMLLLFLINTFTSSTNALLSAVASAVSITSHYTNFSNGIFNLGDAIFYFSMAAIFVFLTVRVLDKRRWG